MSIYNKEYLNDLDFYLEKLNIEKIKNKSFLITGATGLICSYLVDLLMYANKKYDCNITVYPLARNEESIKSRFYEYINDKNFKPIIQDVCNPITMDNIDYIIHGASNSNPKLYITDPVGTMNANYLGMLNVLELAKKNNSSVVYISSSEVYGQKAEIKEFTEQDYGYVNILNVRSSYASSKRASETLCVSYKEQYGCNVKIVRPAHIYGPTFTKHDTRAVSDFLRNAKNEENIIMKSDGSSVRSYCYVGDTVLAILIVLFKGVNGETYNISNNEDMISIKELASKITDYSNTRLIIDIPDDKINKKINTNNKYIKISSKKIEELDWKNYTNINEGLKKTITILKSLSKIKKSYNTNKGDNTYGI